METVTDFEVLVFGLLTTISTLIIKRIFSNRLKEEEFEEEKKADGSYRKKSKKKYK